MDKFIVTKVGKSFYKDGHAGRPILKDISLEWNEGEILSVMGASGSGKSTLAKMLVGLETPSQGTIHFDDENISQWTAKQWREKRRYIQAVFQDSSGTLNHGLSVYQNMEEPLKNLTRKTKEERRKIIEELMDKTSMSPDLLKIRTRNLSGGEQRRLSLLRTLSVKPKFIVLDEVTSGLDYKTEKAICSLLKDYHENFSVAYLIITHDEKMAKMLSKKIFYMEDGSFKRLGEKKI